MSSFSCAVAGVTVALFEKVSFAGFAARPVTVSVARPLAANFRWSAAPRVQVSVFDDFFAMRYESCFDPPVLSFAVAVPEQVDEAPQVIVNATTRSDPTVGLIEATLCRTAAFAATGTATVTISDAINAQTRP